MAVEREFEIIIVGAGHSGAQTGLALRKRGFDGAIGLIGEEPDPPYERPPLTKGYLEGATSRDRLFIRGGKVWSEKDIELIRNCQIEAIDLDNCTIKSGDGRAFAFKYLVWAAGGTARQLACEGATLPGVRQIRTVADVDWILTNLSQVSRVIVIGGGFIGLETSAGLRKLGKEVVLLEAEDRVLARVCAEPVSRFFEQAHRDAGVDIRLSAAVDRILQVGNKAAGVQLASGEEITGDLIIVGIGIAPNIDPLVQAGIACGRGVRVDARCRTSAANVFAVGDCTEYRSAWTENTWVGLESIQNANQMATVCADAMLGLDTTHTVVPWFWSNQFDIRLQTIGLSIGADNWLVRGNPEERSFSVIYLRNNTIIALDCINATADYIEAKKVLLRRAPDDLKILADPSCKLTVACDAALSGII